MPYRHIALQNFRSYHNQSIALNVGVNIVVGPNGSGKTNLLEALYVISTGTSFRAVDRDLVKHDAQWFRIEAQDDDSTRALAYSVADDPNPKRFNLDGVKRVRLSYQQKIPVVLFEPDHLRLLSGSPSGRRDYLDGVLAKLQPDFTRARSQFERALLQRNSILKHAERRCAALEDQIFVWNIKLVELAENIVERRLGLIAYMNERINGLYSHIADAPSKVRLKYDSELAIDNYKQTMLSQLDAHLNRDILRGFTGVGPHRDGFVLYLNGARSSTSASRGEVRSLLLALKMIELDMLSSQHTHPPLLLLDDVFSELDVSRRHALSQLASTYQTVITTTDADAIVPHFRGDYRVIETVG
jgi:DNA replication and repair protein RecF